MIIWPHLLRVQILSQTARSRTLQADASLLGSSYSRNTAGARALPIQGAQLAGSTTRAARSRFAPPGSCRRHDGPRVGCTPVQIPNRESSV